MNALKKCIVFFIYFYLNFLIFQLSSHSFYGSNSKKSLVKSILKIFLRSNDNDDLGLDLNLEIYTKIYISSFFMLEQVQP